AGAPPGRNGRQTVPQTAAARWSVVRVAWGPLCPARRDLQELPIRCAWWPLLEVPFSLPRSRPELAERVDRGVIAEKSLQHTGNQEGAVADVILFVQFQREPVTPAQAGVGAVADPGQAPPALQASDALDQLPVDGGQLRRRFRIGEVAQAQDFLQCVASLGVLHQRHLVEAQ